MAGAGQPDEAGQALEAVRHQLAVLCRRSRCQKLGWPRDWAPGSVVDPRDAARQVFTERGVWEFIAEVLESGVSIEEIELQTPAGKKAYVLIADGGEKRPPIYIKLQLGSGQIIGRSFHYSKQT